MKGQGWRTAVFGHPADLILRENRLAEIGDDGEGIPISQLRTVIIVSDRVTLTAALLCRLSQQNVPVIVCNRQYLPTGILMGLNQHSEAAGMLMDQARWQQEDKDRVWTRIVVMKILRQYGTLVRAGMLDTKQMPNTDVAFRPSAWVQKEGPVSRMYFHALFGESFVRFAPDDVNAALNYGYSILASSISRSLLDHGYNPVLGVHHCSRDNSFNLSYDIVQPFRPFVDWAVYQNRKEPFSSEYKKKLIALPYTECLYNGHHFSIHDAMDMFTLDVVKAMKDPNHPIGEVESA